MKQLTIEEKAKAYDEAKARMSKAYNSNRCTIGFMNEIFPELAESEDERIRKALINYFNNFHLQTFADLNPKKILDWLEKQGEQETLCDKCRKEQPSHSCQDITELGRCAVEHKQKPDDKIEPKFEIEEGKWYVCTQTYTLRGKIVAIKGQTYKSNQNGAIEVEDGHLFIDKIDGKALNYFKPWTIEDAKDGDVLATEDWVFIFEKINSNEKPVCYCHYDIELGFRIDTNSYIASSSEIYPATKEQRDILFQKMREAGYKWDADKKELKKIEQKPAEDRYMEGYLNGTNDASKTLKSAAWSKEDKEIIDYLIDYLESELDSSYTDLDKETFTKEINWLKSIRHQATWKPSDEQMEYLAKAIATLGDEGDCKTASILNCLRVELKKLREE